MSPSCLFIAALLTAPGEPLPGAPAPSQDTSRAPPDASAPARRPPIDQAPSLTELRAAARALLLAEPERAASLVRRSRRAALLPEVRLRAERRFGRSEGLDLVPSSPTNPSDPVALDTVNDVRYEIRATWDLSRVVFNPDELHAQAQALRMADARMEVESLLIRLYFERRRLLTDRLNGRAGEAAWTRIDEIEAELDALTGGAFFAPRRARTSETP